eukprot:3939010-Rhodomonas_salina.3
MYLHLYQHTLVHIFTSIPISIATYPLCVLLLGLRGVSGQDRRDRARGRVLDRDLAGPTHVISQSTASESTTRTLRSARLGDSGGQYLARKLLGQAVLRVIPLWYPHPLVSCCRCRSECVGR